jgi:hypothetical protein
VLCGEAAVGADALADVGVDVLDAVDPVRCREGLADINKFLTARWNRPSGELKPLRDETVCCPLCMPDALLSGVDTSRPRHSP